MALADIQPFAKDANTLANITMQEASATTTWDNAEGDANWDVTPASSNEPQIESSTLPNANFTYAKIFDNNDYASTADPSEMPTGNFTVEFLFYQDPDTPTDTEGIICKYASSGSERSLLIGNSNSTSTGAGKYITFGVTADGTTFKTVSTATAPADSAWHYIACVFVAGTSMSIYLDGNRSGYSTTSIPASMKNSTADLFYGRYNSSWGGANAFEGMLCGVRISNTVRTAKEIWETWNGSAISSVSGSTSLSTNLVSYWELEEASGERADSKGSNNLTDNNTVTSTTGIQGTCASFASSSSEYLSKTSASGIPSGSNAFSFGYWWKSSTNDSVSIEWGTAGSLTRIEGYHPANKVAILLNGGNVYWAATNSNDGNWHYIVVTHAGGQVSTTNTKGYMDGVALTADSSDAQTPNISATPTIAVGRSTLEAANYVNGQLDEVAIWSRALTSGEVAALYNAGTGIPYAAAASGPASLKTRDTIAKASIKSVDGVLIASVKSIDTVT